MISHRCDKCVALFTRAWIEISVHEYYSCWYSVALFTRAWIEILIELFLTEFIRVALFTRAWIEMFSMYSICLFLLRRPLHEGVD